MLWCDKIKKKSHDEIQQNVTVLNYHNFSTSKTIKKQIVLLHNILYLVRLDNVFNPFIIG